MDPSDGNFIHLFVEFERFSNVFMVMVKLFSVTAARRTTSDGNLCDWSGQFSQIK